jgi:phospholipase C
MLENRSFDHVLGSLGERVDGVTPDMVNHDLAGNPWRVGALELPRSSAFVPGPPHDHDSVHFQIGDGTMSGFVAAYQKQYPEAGDLDPGDVMRQLDRPHQPMTYFLADEFTICNRWFSAVPTDTIPNRLYSLCGEAGPVKSTDANTALAEIPALDSIFEQLDPEHWRLFSGSIPLAFAVSPIRTIVLDHDRWHTLSEFADLVPKLPKLTWIDPTYYWLEAANGLPRRLAHVDSKFPIPNDDHPPSQTERGQELVRYVYESLIAQPEVWANTVLIITYDEHGGFFDHVQPPAIAEADRGADGFTQRGPRVPALIVSPYAARGAVCGKTFDHCSILKFLCDWLGLPKWTRRIASTEIGSVADALTTVQRTDAPVPPHELALPTAGPPVHPHHVNLPGLVANIQRATHAEYREKYEARFPEARTHPPGSEMAPLQL